METSFTECDDSKWRKARALFDNRSECADELAFLRGDVLTVLTPNRPPPDGWWLCSLRGRQGLCPANRLRLLPETTRDKSESNVKLRRAKSMHHSTGPDDSPLAFQKSQIKRSASNLSGVRPASQNARTCSPETYDTPPSPRFALRPAFVLEYDVPRPPPASNRSQWPRGPIVPPSPLPLAGPATERGGTAAAAAAAAQASYSVPERVGPPSTNPAPVGSSQACTNGSRGWTSSSAAGADTEHRNGSPLVTGDKPQTLKCASNGILHSQSKQFKEKTAQKAASQPQTALYMSLEEQEMQMNAVLAELLGGVNTNKSQPPSTPNTWQGGRPTVSSSRPRSDNVDSCESSPMTSPCSSQRFSDSTSSSWMAAPSVGRTMSPPVSHVAAPLPSPVVTPRAGTVTAPPVCRRTLLRLERELLSALQRVQERRRCLSEEAATLSFQLNVTRLRSALRDLLQFTSCTAGAAAAAAAGAGAGAGAGAELERALAPLREADQQLELAAGRQEAAGWRSRAPRTSMEGGDGMKELYVAVNTLTAHLPLLDKSQSCHITSWRSESSATPDRHSLTDRSDSSHSWPLPLAAFSSDGSGGGRIKSGIFSDRAVTAFHLKQCETHQVLLREALERLMQAARGTQPSSVLLVLCQFVVLSAHRLVIIGDAVGSSAEDQKAGWRVLTASDQLFIALRRTLRATKAAEAEEESDSSETVREMADATKLLAEAATDLDRNIAQLPALRDAKRMIRGKQRELTMLVNV